MITTIEQLMREVDDFAAERNWEKFHTPKNLAMSIAIEAGELMEIFQWLTPDESGRVAGDASELARVEGEIADILIYLARLCSVLSVDPIAVATSKLEANRSRQWPR